MRLSPWTALIVSLGMLFPVGSSFGASAEDVSAAAIEAAKDAQSEAIRNPADDTALDRFIATLGLSGHGPNLFIMEGDLPMTRDEIRGYLINRHLEINQKTSEIDRSSNELLVNMVAGKYDFWPVGKRRLTYFFDKLSFPKGTNAEAVKGNFRKAADEWTAACPECGVEFVEVEQIEKAEFAVRFQERPDSVVAEAFFPSYARERHVLLVYPEYFRTEFNPVGVFRHEIGHILGYAHEHIQKALSGCARENTRWAQLSDYTPNSVMHYFCGGVGSRELALRDNDKVGHRCLYKTGRPCPKTLGGNK